MSDFFSPVACVTLGCSTLLHIQLVFTAMSSSQMAGAVHCFGADCVQYTCSLVFCIVLCFRYSMQFRRVIAYSNLDLVVHGQVREYTGYSSTCCRSLYLLTAILDQYSFVAALLAETYIKRYSGLEFHSVQLQMKKLLSGENESK